MTPDSLWAIKWWEAAMPLVLACLLVTLTFVFSRRARSNRAKLRRRRRSDQELVQRLRAW